MKAVLRNGVIYPQEPLPHDWTDGTEVEVAKADAVAHPTDAWMDEVEASAAQGDPADDERLAAAVRDVRRREKEAARKRLGLEP